MQRNINPEIALAMGKKKKMPKPQHDPLLQAILTKREQEVAALIAEEYNYKMISVKLKISVRTVETHAHNIHSKTGKHNIAGVINYLRGNSKK